MPTDKEPLIHPMADDSPFEDKADDLLSLLLSRSRGNASNGQVEEAISSLISGQLVADDEDYDDDNSSDDKANGTATISKTEEGSELAIKTPTESSPTSSHAAEVRWTGKKATIESLKEQDKQMESKRRQDDRGNWMKLSEHWDNLDSIPLGRSGAKMMVTFGDGRNPNPDAVAAALLGTRQCLQHAVKDARALNRKMKEDYRRAKVVVNLHSAHSRDRDYFAGAADAEVDAETMFRVLSRERQDDFAQCGFGVLQLEKLFPEEMHAYSRYMQMQKAYMNSKGDKGVQSTDADMGGKLEENDVAKAEKDWVGGHLGDRLAQFDVRTEQMVDEWYMTFSEVRRGSFLPKSNMPEDRQWERKRKGKRGRRGKVSWESLPAASVQFLHWLGFDQRSGLLPPPNEETTQALAFLGYDFMGKIVEKAIFLRCLAKREKDRENGLNETNLILQLQGGEQLSLEDINRALNDTTVVSKPLYHSPHSVLEPSTEAAQLYFGPGCEDRLEVEMEQFFGAKGKKAKISESENEKKIRLEEDDLFSKMSAPPTALGGVMDLLGEEHVTKEMLEQRKITKERQKALDMLKTVPKSQRKRGRKPKGDISKDALEVDAKRRRNAP